MKYEEFDCITLKDGRDGAIVEVLGDNMGTGMAVDMALRTHEIPYVWPHAVEKHV